MIRTCNPRAVMIPGSFVLVALIAIVGFGCSGGPAGPAIHPVSGKVTFEGNPVKAGVIAFANDSQGSLYEAQLASGGSYTLISPHGSGIPVGSYKISINPPSQTGPPDPAKEDTPVEAPSAEDIPEKYRQFSTSGLTAEVKEGDNTFDFDMKP